MIMVVPNTTTSSKVRCRPCMLQLDDPSLLKEACYVNGQWVAAKSGKVFSVESELQPTHPVGAAIATPLTLTLNIYLTFPFFPVTRTNSNEQIR